MPKTYPYVDESLLLEELDDNFTKLLGVAAFLGMVWAVFLKEAVDG